MNRYSHLEKPRKRPLVSGKFIATGVGIAVVGAIAVGGFVLYSSTQETQTCTVDSKDRSVKVTSSDNGAVSSRTDLRVYTTDCGTFSVSDDMLRGKFNSSDTYGKLQDGHTYEMDTIGWRNGFFSLFPNILEAREVK